MNVLRDQLLNVVHYKETTHRKNKLQHLDLQLNSVIPKLLYGAGDYHMLSRRQIFVSNLCSSACFLNRSFYSRYARVVEKCKSVHTSWKTIWKSIATKNVSFNPSRRKEIERQIRKKANWRKKNKFVCSKTKNIGYNWTHSNEGS